MDEPETPDPSSVELAKRREACFVAYIHPFRIVESPSLSPWKVTIKQVNRAAWDYVALHEVAGRIDVERPSPYRMMVARDGALSVPHLEHLDSIETTIEFVNRSLAALLLGGVYCEAIAPDGLDRGSIIDEKYVRVHWYGQAAPNRFHEHVRFRQAGALEAIALYRPRTVKFEELEQAIRTGFDLMERTPSLRGEYLLRGVTGICRKDWGVALINLWIVAEQLISGLWEERVISPTLKSDDSRSRRSQLADTRTWTASARLEMLFQIGAIRAHDLKTLSVARKARNELAHSGRAPTMMEAMSAFKGVGFLLTIATRETVPLFRRQTWEQIIAEFFPQWLGQPGEPELWMEIPKLPGELELERAEAKVRNTTRGPKSQS